MVPQVLQNKIYCYETLKNFSRASYVDFGTLYMFVGARGSVVG
jgi:hypothetical protein